MGGLLGSCSTLQYDLSAAPRVGDAAGARPSAAGTLRSCASWRWPDDSSALLGDCQA